MPTYKGKIPIIYRSLNEGFLRGGEDLSNLSTGAVPRDFDEDPVEMRDSPDALPLFEDDQILDIYHQQEKEENSLEHLYLRNDQPAFEFLDQNGFPDCWAHSTAHGLMFDYLKMGLTPPRFNAVAVATMLKRTNGGWSGLSLKFARDHGFPVIGDGPGEWPYQTRKGRDDSRLREAMATHKSVEEIYDLGKREYDQTLSKKQQKSCGAQNLPMMADFNRFGHAMLQIRTVPIGNVLCPLILNSWKGFGYHGLCVLSDMWADGACAIRTSTPSVR